MKNNSQSPSIQAIYNNALPFYLDRADLNSISEDGNAFADSLVQHLLQGEVIQQFDASISATDKLQHLYFEAKNLTRTLGAKTFGLGYPLLIDTYEGELLVAPVFIWQLSLEPAQTKLNAWVVKFEKQHPVQPNYQLIRHLKEKYDFDCTEQYKKAIKHDRLDRNIFIRFINDIAERFHLDNIKTDNFVSEAPGIDEIGEYTERGAIHWSGVVGIYPPQHKNWTAGKYKPEDVFVDAGDYVNKDSFVLSIIGSDPEQVTAHELASQKAVSIIEGVDALGKMQVLVNILTTALIQGKKCLVVSERAPALKRAQDMVAKAGINQLNFLLTDAINDSDQFLEMLKAAAKGVGKEISLDEKDFQYKKNKFLRAKKRLEATYSAVKKPLFGSANWTDVVGLFLANQRVEGKELLSNHLNKADFKFELKEYKFLKAGVEKCYPLFTQIKTLNHALSDLNDRVFQQVSIEDGRNYIESQLAIYLKKCRALHLQYISEIENYKTKLSQHLEQYATELGIRYGLLNEKILSYTDQFGKDFLEARPRTFRLPILFSKKKKKIQSAQTDVANGYKDLKHAFEENPYFEFKFSSAKEGMQIEEVIKNLRAFDHEFACWKEKLEDLIHEESIRLNSKTTHSSLGLKEEIAQLEYSLDELLEELNEAKLYQKQFENKTLTVSKRQRYLESIIEQMETTHLHLREFDQFYQWQSQWLQIGEVGQKVIKALVKVKPANWTAAFESWYFYNLLSENQDDALPTNLTAITDFNETYYALKPLIFNHIAKYWQQNQVKGLKGLKKNNKEKYQNIFDKTYLKNHPDENILEELLDGGMETVTDFFPILFVSSHVALNVLPSSFQFDMVIYNEANQFSVEPSTDIAALGKQLVVFGSNDSNGNETSLLQYALENGVPAASITNKYEAPVPFLSNLAASGYAIRFAQACSVENLEGRFHEMDGTNDFEAQHVIRILNQIKQTPQRVYPSVGIVTFTIEQRDLIAGYILKLKQQNALGSEKIRHLERNGMSVIFIDELFGQQFDVLVVSCTFGAINIKGKLTKRMALLNSQEGISFMHLLINKPLQKLYLLHSFNGEHLQEMRGKPWEKGYWLLSHFIKMAEAAEQKNEVIFLEQLEVIGKKELRQNINSNFVREVTIALKAYIDPERLSSHVPWEDIILPLVVKPVTVNAPEIMIHPDGFFADTTYTSGIWEQTHLQKLAENQFEIIPVWSVNWLKNPSHEARKLASQIIKIDNQYPEDQSDGIKSPTDVKQDEVKDL